MSESVMQKMGPRDPDAMCWLCHTTRDLERHHVFQGANRNHSEEEGCWCFLCRHCHHDVVHAHREIEISGRGKVDAMQFLHETCQTMWEHAHGDDREGFMRIFGRSWL